MVDRELQQACPTVAKYLEVEEMRHMVVQVAAYGGQAVHQLHARLGQYLWVAHAAQLQDLRGCYCAGAVDQMCGG